MDIDSEEGYSASSDEVKDENGFESEAGIKVRVDDEDDP